MENNLKLPRVGTIARAVIDELIEAGPDGLRHSDLDYIYWLEQKNHAGRGYWLKQKNHSGRGSPSWADRTNGMTLYRLLKKYGHKTGVPGTRAPWVFGSKPTNTSRLPTTDFSNRETPFDFLADVSQRTRDLRIELDASINDDMNFKLKSIISKLTLRERRELLVILDCDLGPVKDCPSYLG